MHRIHMHTHMCMHMCTPTGVLCTHIHTNYALSVVSG